MSPRHRRPVAVVGLLVTTAPAICGSAAEAGSPAGAAALHLYVDDQSYAVQPGEAFESTIRVEGSADAVAASAAAGADVVIGVHEAVVDAAPLDQSVGQAIDSVALDAAAVLASAGSGAGGSISVPVGLATNEEGSLDVTAPGVYPVTVELRSGSESAVATTFLEVLDPAAPVQPLSIAVLAAVADPAQFAGLVDVAAMVEAPLSVALTPAVAGAVLAASDPAAPQGDALRFDELVALPAADLDPSAVVAVEESDAFIRMLRNGEDILSAASPLAVVSRAAWIADRPISGPAAAMLRDLGVRMLVITDDVSGDLGGNPATDVFAVALGAGDTLPAMTIDPLGVELTAGTSVTEATASQRAARLLAGLRLARSDGAPAVVLAAPGLAAPDGDVTARLAEFIVDLPGTNIVGLSRLPGIAAGGLADGTPPIALPPVAGTDLSKRRTEIEAVREDANHAATMLVDSPLPDAWERRLDAVLASDIDDATAAARLAEIDAEVDAVLSAIVAPEPFTFTLTGTSNTLRLPIRNTAEEPLRVDVRVRSPKLTTDEPTQQVDVPGLSSVEVEVPVEARSKGTFTIEVDVLAPDGHRLGPPVVLKGRVSHVSGLSQVVTGGAALILASWWYTHLRRRRAERRARRAMIQP
jgi:hypothetical protein